MMGELIALCEDTIKRYGDLAPRDDELGAFARGRIEQAVVVIDVIKRLERVPGRVTNPSFP